MRIGAGAPPFTSPSGIVGDLHGRRAGLGLDAEPLLVQGGEVALLLQRRDDVVDLGWLSGESLANMTEYFSPVGIRSTTFKSGLSLV